MYSNLHLGVNIDHVATLRQVRRARFPDPLQAALRCEQAGADSITLHLREDRRHIQERDVLVMREALQTHMNLELAATAQMLEFAARVRPADCCLVPENRDEITTEGGLDLVLHEPRVRDACARLSEAGVRVSLFIDPDEAQVNAARRCNAPVIELHTGAYAEKSGAHRARELERLRSAAQLADSLGLIVHAGHGLDYHNVMPVAAIEPLVELNIGHAIIARAVFDGIERAVRDMKELMLRARS